MDVDHDLIQKAISYNNAAIVSVKQNAYKIHFWYVDKLLNDANLSIKSGYLQKHKKIFIFYV